MARKHRRKPWRRVVAQLPKILAALVATAVIAGGGYFLTRKSPEDFYKAGVALYQSGDSKGAAIELKNLLQATPNNGEARFLLGKIHFANGDFQAAEKELQKAVDLRVKDADLTPLYARTLLMLNKPKELLEAVKERQDVPQETNAAILALRARANLLLHDLTLAEEDLVAADARFDRHPETLVTRAMQAFSQKNNDLALDFVNQALAKLDKRDDLWVMKGDLLRLMKRNPEAQQAYTKAVALAPRNTPARLASAQYHLEAGALDKADIELSALRKYEPNNLMGRYLEAYVDFKRSKTADADTKLQDVLRTSPGFLPGHLLGGAVKLALGNREAARFHLDKVLHAAPQHPLARKLMAATLADMGDVTQARKILDTFGVGETDPLLSSMQGELALRQGDFKQARAHLEKMGDQSPQTPKYFTELAASRMGTGDEAGAIQALSKAAELDTSTSKPDVLLVLTHIKQKNYTAASAAVEKLAKERPSDPLIHNLRGTISISQQDKAQARAHFTKAIEIKPSYFPAVSNLALLDMQDKNPKAARTRFEQLLKVAPKEVRGWLSLAALEANQKNEAGYLKSLEQAKIVDPKNIQAHFLLTRFWLAKNDSGKALSSAREALEATGRNEFQELVGLAYLQQKDHASALAAFTRWAETSPNNPMTHFRVAQARVLGKDNSNALIALDKAIALRPDFAEAKSTKALLLGRMGRSTEALKLAQGLQSSYPKSAVGYLAEAEILFNEKQYIESGKRFAKASQLSGQGQPLARAYQAYAMGGQAAEGEKLLQQWVTQHPQDAAVRHQLALVQLNSNRQKEAAENYQFLVKANPKDYVALNNLAWLLGELKAPNALAVAEQAYKLNPADPGIQDTFGWILVNAGQTARGLDLLKKAVAKAPNALDIHWHLAAAYDKAGDRVNALANLELLLSKDRNFAGKQDAMTLYTKLKQVAK